MTIKAEIDPTIQMALDKYGFIEQSKKEFVKLNIAVEQLKAEN